MTKKQWISVVLNHNLKRPDPGRGAQSAETAGSPASVTADGRYSQIQSVGNHGPRTATEWVPGKGGGSTGRFLCFVLRRRWPRKREPRRGEAVGQQNTEL